MSLSVDPWRSALPEMTSGIAEQPTAAPRCRPCASRFWTRDRTSGSHQVDRGSCQKAPPRVPPLDLHLPSSMPRSWSSIPHKRPSIFLCARRSTTLSRAKHRTAHPADLWPCERPRHILLSLAVSFVCAGNFWNALPNERLRDDKLRFAAGGGFRSLKHAEDFVKIVSVDNKRPSRMPQSAPRYLRFASPEPTHPASRC